MKSTSCIKATSKVCGSIFLTESLDFQLKVWYACHNGVAITQNRSKNKELDDCTCNERRQCVAANEENKGQQAHNDDHDLNSIAPDRGPVAVQTSTIQSGRGTVILAGSALLPPRMLEGSTP